MPLASRIGDLHVCLAHPPVPLPIAKGAKSVLIGFSPAARITDECACPGNAKIVTGAPTVLIEQQPAARLGDVTGPPGVVVSGYPTVIIGETPQIAALVAAALSGAPFCEECAAGALAEPTGEGP